MSGPGDSPIGRFELVDHYGLPVSERTFLGQHVLLFFGFTRCRIVCPRALTKLSGALERVGPAAARVAPLYVTVDPDRDDPDTMRTFLARWPRFLGLVGNESQIETIRKSFRVYAQRRDGAGADYQLAHSSLTHLLDPVGRHVDHWGDHLCEGEICERLTRHLVGEGSPAIGGPG